MGDSYASIGGEEGEGFLACRDESCAMRILQSLQRLQYLLQPCRHPTYPPHQSRSQDFVKESYISYIEDSFQDRLIALVQKGFSFRRQSDVIAWLVAYLLLTTSTVVE